MSYEAKRVKENNYLCLKVKRFLLQLLSYYSAHQSLAQSEVFQPRADYIPHFELSGQMNTVNICIKGTYVGKIYIFLKNWHPVRGPMSFVAKGKKNPKSRQTNTSHCPTKTISKIDTRPFK